MSVASELRDAVVTLKPCYEGDCDGYEEAAYRQGYRDARRDAAELVTTSDALRRLEESHGRLLAAAKALVEPSSHTPTTYGQALDGLRAAVKAAVGE